jgi:hypothetical protein
MTCPEGYITRKSYTRKFSNNVAQAGYTVRRRGKLYTIRPKVSSVKVPSSCVKRHSSIKNSAKIGKLRKGDLIKYGYQFRLSDRLRHIALEKAIKAYGLTSVFHKLDAIAKLSAHVYPDASKIFARDREWIHQKMQDKK